MKASRACVFDPFCFLTVFSIRPTAQPSFCPAVLLTMSYTLELGAKAKSCFLKLFLSDIEKNYYNHHSGKAWQTKAAHFTVIRRREQSKPVMPGFFLSLVPSLVLTVGCPHSGQVVSPQLMWSSGTPSWTLQE